MTTADLLALIWRWRLLVPVGLLLTGMAVHHVRDSQPVYWAQTDLRVVPPVGDVNANQLTSSSSGLIAMAGLVVREEDHSDPPAVSDSADLPGLGVRDGWQLRLPNSGGQWAMNFDRPVIDVQVVGPSPEEVTTRVEELTARVGRELDRLQAADGIPPTSRMGLQTDPAGFPMLRLAGSPARAEIVTVLLGIWATLAAVLAAGPVALGCRRAARRLGVPTWRRRPRRLAGAE